MILTTFDNLPVLIDDEDQIKLKDLTICRIAKGYAACFDPITKKHYYLHRFILELTSTHLQVDHINGNRLDNRKENLRVCTPAQNAQNRKIVAATSGLKGAYFDKNRKGKQWYSRFREPSGINRGLGYFNTAQEAHEAYMLAASIYQGKFSNKGNVA